MQRVLIIYCFICNAQVRCIFSLVKLPLWSDLRLRLVHPAGPAGALMLSYVVLYMMQKVSL